MDERVLMQWGGPHAHPLEFYLAKGNLLGLIYDPRTHSYTDMASIEGHIKDWREIDADTLEQLATDEISGRLDGFHNMACHDILTIHSGLFD